MEYFGCIKPILIEEGNVKKTADFLIKNKLYKEATKKRYYFSDHFNDEEDSCKNDLNNNNTIQAGQVFVPTVIMFTKEVSKQLWQQLKKDIKRYIKIQIKDKVDLNDLLQSEIILSKLEPTNILLDDVYSSFINNYYELILFEKCSFYDNFNEQIFGLDFYKQKEVALKHYKKIYKSLFEDNITYMPDDFCDSDDFENDIVTIDNKLRMVCNNKLKFQHKLAVINPFIEYLIGNKLIFSRKYYERNIEIIKEILKYESSKTIMIELNTKYEFEEDFYFINTIEDKMKYEKYSKIFNSFKAYKFTNISISDYDGDIKAYIESLYEFLRVNKLINKGKAEFLKYLEYEHNILLTKIIAYINYDNRKDFPVDGKKPNDEHIKRVDIIQEKWSLFP